METSNWISATRENNSWDRLYLDGEEVPCHRVTVDGFDTGRKLDIKGRKGEDGADYTDNGFEPAKGTITFEWLDAEKAALGESILEKYEPRSKGNVARPVVITHPCPNENGVERVVIETKGAPKVSKGIRSRVLKVVEYFPAAPKKGQGKKTSAPVGYNSYDDDVSAVNDYYDQRNRETGYDVEDGRISPEDGAEAFLANDTDRINALRDLYEANNQPAAPDNVDANTFD